MDERQILKLYRGQDPRAAADAARDRYEPFCLAIACNILGNDRDAEACVAAVWERAWDQFSRRPPAILSAGLGRITRDLALERRTAGKRQEESEVPLALRELEQALGAGDKSAGAAEAAAETEAFLRGQTMLRRMVFLRRYWYFNALPVIAKQLSLPEARVSRILSSMTGALAARLPGTGGALFLASLSGLPDDLVAEGNVRRRHLLLRIAVILLCILLLLSSLYPFLRNTLQR